MQDKINRVCLICGVSYLACPNRLSHGRQTTCSRVCSYQRRATSLSRQTAMACAVCGDEFSRAPSQVKSKHGYVFCSRECHYIGRSAGLVKREVVHPYTYSNDGIVKLRKTGARAYASGKTLPHPKTELAARAALERLGICHAYQQVFEHEDGAFVCDFFFAAISRVVELDGPSHYGKARKRDAERDAILSSAGIEVIRVRDNGIESDAARAVVWAALRGGEPRSSDVIPSTSPAVRA